MRRVRLRLWFVAIDVARVLRAPWPVQLWLIGRAAAADYWGEPVEPAPPGDRPF